MASLNSIIRALSVTLVVAPAVVHEQTDRQLVRSSAAFSIEAESLVGSAETTYGRVSVQNMGGFGPGWSGAAQLFWGGGQSGARLRLSFPTAVTGRYQAFLHFTRGPDFAVVRAALDGAQTVTFNGYAPTVSPDRVLLGMHDWTPGNHELRLEVMTKDGKSAGFNVGLDRIELKPLDDRSTSRNPPGAQEPSVEGAVGAASIPVLQVPARSTSRDEAPVQQAIEPLPMSERVQIVQKALASTSTTVGEPGEPLVLSARLPKRNQSGLKLLHGELDTRHGYGAIRLSPPAATLTLIYEPVAPGRPHLLECAYRNNKDGAVAEVRVSALVANKDVELSTLSLAPAPSEKGRLLAVVVPSEPRFQLMLKPVKGDLIVTYCALTPFK